MKKIIPLLTISVLLYSCGLKLEKTNKLDSLLDVGFTADTTANLKDDMLNTADLSPSSSVFYGIDISHFQGNIMEAYSAKDSLSFVICKATQGDDFVDPEFKDNWHQIKAKGLIRGTYHFYVCADDPITQANHFLSTVADLGPNDMAPILDIEQGSMSKNISGKQMVADILVFLKRVEQQINRKPMLYTDYAFAQQYFKDSPHSAELAEYKLWLAEYSGNAQPKIPTTWEAKGYKIWQKSASYSLDDKKVDYDAYTGPLSEIVN